MLAGLPPIIVGPSGSPPAVSARPAGTDSSQAVSSVLPITGLFVTLGIPEPDRLDVTKL